MIEFHYFMKLRSLILAACLLFSLVSHAKKAEKPPERGILHNNRGVEALYKGDTDRALFEFKTATELSPNYVEAWSNLGLAYKYKGRLVDAEVALKKAISLDKKYANSYNHLGAVYFDMGHYDDALAYYAKALHYNDKLSDAHYNASLVYIARYKKDKNRNNLESAVKELQSATVVNAEHAHAHKELAKAYQDLGDYEKAIIRYKLALEIDPSITDGWTSLAKLYTLTGQTLKAQEALNKALQQNPNSAPSHLNLGLNYLKDENYRMAIKEFNAAIQVEPTNEIGYFNVGFAYYKKALQENQDNPTAALQDFKQSNAAYESAFKLRPTYTEAAFNIAYNYIFMKDNTNAIAWFQKAIASDASFTRSYFALAQVYETIGQKSDAARYFCEFIKLKPSNMSDELNIATSSVKALGGCP